MWKKQWNKLKTALGTPEEYVTEEEQEVEAVEEKSDEPQYNSEQVIEVVNQDFVPLGKTIESIKSLKTQIGEMTLRHEQERARAVQLNSDLNQQWEEQINNLRTIYNVEPTVDYELNFPTEEGGTGSFVRRESSEE